MRAGPNAQGQGVGSISKRQKSQWFFLPPRYG
jgi:hypothetical protein